MNESMQLCPRCGARLASTPRFAVCLIVILALMALPSALAGACFLAFSGMESGRPDGGVLLIGLAGIGFAALCIWGIVHLVKARRG
jgi:hypothetical protein